MSLIKRNLVIKITNTQNQEQKHKNKVPTMPTADNEATSATPMASP